MTARQYFLGIFIFYSCGSPTTTLDKHSKEVILNNSDSSSINKTLLAGSSSIHLQDTTFIKGNFVLFLRPDNARFDSYAKENDDVYEADSDFGFGITATIGSIAKDIKYMGIETDISTNRYIVIEDCKNCPLTYDRDTINYGFILTAKGKEVEINTFIHSRDYLDNVDRYFNKINDKQTRNSEQ